MDEDDDRKPATGSWQAKLACEHGRLTAGRSCEELLFTQGHTTHGMDLDADPLSPGSTDAPRSRSGDNEHRENRQNRTCVHTVPPSPLIVPAVVEATTTTAHPLYEQDSSSWRRDVIEQ